MMQSREKLYLVDGRKLHWNNFFESESGFRGFLKKFEKFKTNKPENFMKAFHDLLTKYNTTINIKNNSDECCSLNFDINGDVTELKVGKPINAGRILDIISLRGKLNA